MFAGAKFCSHCGAKGTRSEVGGGEPRLCPRCQFALKSVTIGPTDLLECSRCEGIWVDAETLQQICADREKQALASSASTLDQPLEIEKTIRYVPCPVCHELMNRVQFAQCSHVIVDVCKAHGTWFDKHELQRAVQFIRAGGLDKARAQQLEQLKEERRRLVVSRLYGGTIEPGTPSPSANGGFGLTTSAIHILLDLLS
jgi:Zn-finger nucleic acid-binding protein